MGRGLLVAGVALVLGAACTKRNPEVCCTTEADCAAKGLPDGTDCAADLTCVNNRCTEVTTCQAMSDCRSPTPLCETGSGVCVQCFTSDECGDQVCDSETFACRGCTADEECSGHCNTESGLCVSGFVPRYVADACELGSFPDLVFADEFASISTNDNAVCTGGVVAQGGVNPSLCVMRPRSVVVSDRLRVVGLSGLVIVADEDITVTSAGEIDMTAVGRQGGPGALPLQGPIPQQPAGVGWGGIGFKTAGGNGGGSTSNGFPAVDISTNPAFFGGPSAVMLDSGGGGALMLVSCHGKVTIGGMISAGGSGGGVDFYGGGAGGHVLIQAWDIEVTGRILVNGGGGAASGTGAGANGALSADLCGSTRAGTDGNGAGGAGGCFALPPTNGAAATTGDRVGGGGGGSVGFIRTAMPAGRTPVLPDASDANSPIVEPNETLETQPAAQ